MTCKPHLIVLKNVRYIYANRNSTGQRGGHNCSIKVKDGHDSRGPLVQGGPEQFK